VTTIADILAQARLPETTVRLCLRGDLQARWQELERQLGDADRRKPSLAEPSPAQAIAEQMEQIREDMQASTTVVTLRAVKARAWSDLLLKRPGPKEDDTSDDEHLAAHFGWVCELLAECAVDPEMTAEQAAELCDALSGRQWDELTTAVWTLNSSGVEVPFSAAASALIQPQEQR
jgi:hypothetical protein